MASRHCGNLSVCYMLGEDGEVHLRYNVRVSTDTLKLKKSSSTNHRVFEVG